MAEKKYIMETLVNLNIRSGPSTSFNTVSTSMKKGTRITTSEEQNGWYKHDKGGWSFANNGKYLKLIEDLTGKSEVKQAVTSEEQKSESGLQPSAFSMSNTDYDRYSANVIGVDITQDSFNNIFGMPYQFLPNVDARFKDLGANTNFSFGREFTEKIVKHMPLLILSPGRPAFMEGFNKKQKESAISKMIDIANEGGHSDLDNLMNDLGGQYYSFKFDYSNYYDYVNAMCHTSAMYIGIGDLPVNGKSSGNGKGSSYKRYNWATHYDSSLKGFFSGAEYLCYYIESENQVNESFSNSTGESMLDSGLNRLSDAGKEVDFLLSAGMGVKFDAMNADKFESNKEAISKLLGDYSDPAHVMERLKTGLVTVSAGGQLTFPELWKDSEYSKSYDITVKLISPDGDDESIYNNVLVPMWHLLGLALPMQMGVNGYRSPFLVRGFYKGVFNCDMGIITNMSIRKGDEGAWNINGLPTEVEVSFTLKDLYQILSMTKATDAKMLVKNTQFIDFIANNCGININKPELFRKFDFYMTEKVNSVKYLPTKVWTNFSQTTSNLLMRTFK